jgi:hypothetical protein
MAPEDRLKNMSLQDKIRMLEQIKKLRAHEIKHEEEKLQKELKDIEEKKKKELKELEEKIKREAKDIDSEIVQALSELSIEEQKVFLEAQKKSKSKSDSLEGSVDGEDSNYSLVQKVVQKQNLDFYELTNYNIYNRVREITRRADEGQLNREDRLFIEGLAYNLNKIQENDSYQSKDQDRGNYLSRTATLIDKLDKDFDHFKNV